jgi:hypothetical protein
MENNCGFDAGATINWDDQDDTVFILFDGIIKRIPERLAATFRLFRPAERPNIFFDRRWVQQIYTIHQALRMIDINDKLKI